MIKYVEIYANYSNNRRYGAHMLSGLSGVRADVPNNTSGSNNISAFPISQACIKSLKEQIKNTSNLMLGLDDFLKLAKSTIVEARKGSIQLNSIADINAILEETNIASNMVFAQIGQHIPRFRYGLRVDYFKQVIGLGNNFNPHGFKLLQNHSGFPAHKHVSPLDHQT